MEKLTTDQLVQKIPCRSKSSQFAMNELMRRFREMEEKLKNLTDTNTNLARIAVERCRIAVGENLELFAEMNHLINEANNSGD